MYRESKNWTLNESWRDNQQSYGDSLMSKDSSPPIPLRYQQNERDIRHSIEDDEDDNDFIEAELAQVEHEWKSLDWVFKCTAITLLTLILICSIAIIVQGRQISNALNEGGQIVGSNLKASTGGPSLPSSYRFDPRQSSGANDEVSSKLSIWLKASGLGRTGHKIVSLPAWIIRTGVTLVLAPLKFLFSRLLYFLYICVFMLLVLLFFYWVIHGFMTQTLGEWFMTRLRLPAPKKLVHEFSLKIGLSFFNRWWSLTELIKENLLSYFNCNLDTNYGGLYGTPNPMARRRSTAMWGGRPYPNNRMSTRASVHYPKTQVYQGLPNQNDQKRRLHTINEVNATSQALRQNVNNTNSGSFNAGGGIDRIVLSSRIHNSPFANNRNIGASFDVYEKENDHMNSNVMQQPQSKKDAGGPLNKMKSTYVNPLLVDGSPIRRNMTHKQPNKTGNKFATAPQRFTGRQQPIAKDNISMRTAGGTAAGNGSFGMKAKKGGFAFNVQ